MHLSSQENLSNNTESGLSFKSKTCEVGAFSICTLLHGFGRDLESAVKKESDSADEGSRDIQVLEAEQKPMMSLSCQNLVTGNLKHLRCARIKLAGVLQWEKSGRWMCFSGCVLPLPCSSDPQTAAGLSKFFGLIC